MNLLTEEALQSITLALEVWVPSRNDSELQWHAGECTIAPEFIAKRKQLTIQAGQGAAGKCWQSRTAVVDTNAAQSEPECDMLGVELETIAAFAIPIIQSGNVVAVVVMIVGGSSSAQGALEVWRRNERQELELGDSCYLNLDRFGEISRYVNFPRRAGLPGMTWADKAPKLIAGIGKSKDFMRSAGAKAEGLDVGLGIPIMQSSHELDCVVLMLSSADTPIARAFEVWVPDTFEERPKADGVIEKIPTSLRWERGAYNSCGDLGRTSATQIVRPGVGVAGKVLETGLPLVSSDFSFEEPARAKRLQQSDVDTCLGMPVYIGDDLGAVVVIIK